MINLASKIKNKFAVNHNFLNQYLPVSRSGHNIGGCLINSTIFIAHKGNAIYDSVKNEFVLNLNQNNNDGSSITLFVSEAILAENKTFILKDMKVNTQNKFVSNHAFYIPNNAVFRHLETTQECTGSLTITHYNAIDKIISGKFQFDAIDSKGTIVKIRKGRFDFSFI